MGDMIARVRNLMVAPIEEENPPQVPSPDRTTIAGLPAREVLTVLGIRMPQAVVVEHDVKSLGLFAVDADRLSVMPGVNLDEHDNVVYLSNNGNGLTGNLACSCRGSGSCTIQTGTDDLGNDAVACVRDGCDKACKLDVKIPSDQFAPLLIAAAGVELPEGTRVVGTVRGPGARIMSESVSLRPGSDSRFERTATNRVAMIRNGVVIGEFDCSCKKGSGSCEVEVEGNRLICARGGCMTCGLVVSFPSIQVFA
jgi:hypothetical protein